MNLMKAIFKKSVDYSKRRITEIIRWFQIWDLIWSVPIAIIAFIGISFFGAKIFGEGFGFLPPEYIQALFYSALVAVMFNGLSLLGLRFNFKKIFNWYLSKDALEDYKNLQTWQRFAFFFLLYSFHIIIMLLVLLKLI